jgi:hypothetical protein
MAAVINVSMHGALHSMPYAMYAIYRPRRARCSKGKAALEYPLGMFWIFDFDGHLYLYKLYL